MKQKLTYKEQVFEYIDKLPHGIVHLDKLCKPETREKFIKVMKEYIDERGNYNGYCTEFTNDYSAIKKFDIALRSPKDILRESYGEKIESKI